MTHKLVIHMIRNGQREQGRMVPRFIYATSYCGKSGHLFLTDKHYSFEYFAPSLSSTKGIWAAVEKYNDEYVTCQNCLRHKVGNTIYYKIRRQKK